jgi:hypothetical protein
VLTSGIIPAASIPFPSILFEHVNFATGLNVTPGQILALTFGLAAPGSNEGAAGLFGVEATYTGGQAVIFQGDPGGPWQPFNPLTPPTDFAFRTYVDPVPIPEPGIVLLLGTGVVAALLRKVCAQAKTSLTQPQKDRVLVERLIDSSQQFPRFGYRRTAVYLDESLCRVRRLWRRLGLNLPRRRPRRRRCGSDMRLGRRGGRHLKLRATKDRARPPVEHQVRIDEL